MRALHNVLGTENVCCTRCVFMCVHFIVISEESPAICHCYGETITNATEKVSRKESDCEKWRGEQRERLKKKIRTTTINRYKEYSNDLVYNVLCIRCFSRAPYPFLLKSLKCSFYLYASECVYVCVWPK